MTPDEHSAAELLAQQWPDLVPDEFVAWDAEGTAAWEYRRSIGAEVVETLRSHGYAIVKADPDAEGSLCPRCGSRHYGGAPMCDECLSELIRAGTLTFTPAPTDPGPTTTTFTV